MEIILKSQNIKGYVNNIGNINDNTTATTENWEMDD